MEPFVLFVSFVVVIQATINQFATPIRNLPINRADRSDFRSESSQSNDQSANSHSFVSMAACHVRQSRHVGSDSGNDQNHRLPPSDIDLRKLPIGNSGAFFCSSTCPVHCPLVSTVDSFILGRGSQRIGDDLP